MNWWYMFDKKFTNLVGTKRRNRVKSTTARSVQLEREMYLLFWIHICCSSCRVIQATMTAITMEWAKDPARIVKPPRPSTRMSSKKVLIFVRTLLQPPLLQIFSRFLNGTLLGEGLNSYKDTRPYDKGEKGKADEHIPKVPEVCLLPTKSLFRRPEPVRLVAVAEVFACFELSEVLPRQILPIGLPAILFDDHSVQGNEEEKSKAKVLAHLCRSGSPFLP